MFFPPQFKGKFSTATRFGAAINNGPPPLDLDGLTVLASFDFSNPASVFSDSGRTTPAVEGGRVIGVTDESGNGYHGYWTGIGGLWRDGAVEQPQESGAAGGVFTSTFRIPDIVWNKQNVAFTWLMEPIARHASLNVNAWMMADFALSHGVLQHQLPTVAGNSSIWILPGFSGPWTNTLPWAAERHALTVRIKSNEVKVFRNASSLAQAGTQGSASITGIHMGGHSSAYGQALHGFIARRLIIYESGASDARILQLHDDLKQQWTNVEPTRTVDWFIAGDSISVGYGADCLPYWRQLNQTNTHIRFWNGAVGGVAAAGYLHGLGILQPPEPVMPTMDHVILMVGFNDIKYGYTEAEIKTEIAAWVTANAGSSFTILTIAPEYYFTGASATLKATINTWIKATWPSNHVDLDTAGIVANGTSGDFLTSDTVHLSAQGHRKIAVAVAAHLGLNDPPAL